MKFLPDIFYFILTFYFIERETIFILFNEENYELM